MIQYIKFQDKLLSIIIRSNYKSQGIEFFTPDDFPQQLGYMNRKKGHVIIPHLHNSVKREVSYTKEVLFIKSGKVRIDFYDDKTQIRALSFTCCLYIYNSVGDFTLCE